MIVQRKGNCEVFELYYHGVAWGVPLLIVIITGALGHYGPVATLTIVDGCEHVPTTAFWAILLIFRLLRAPACSNTVSRRQL